MRRKSLLAGILLGLTCAGMAHAAEFYCCQAQGSSRRICGDTLPDACRGSGYRVFDSAGNLLREVGPPLTPEQKAEQAAEARRKKQIEEAAREQRRKDQALLDTYATPQDIDLAQNKAENDISLAIQTAQTNIDEAMIKRKKFENEAEFYKKKALPPGLAKELNALDHQIRLQRELIDLKNREFSVVKAKYDADRKRYYELTGRATAPPQPRPR